MEVKHARYFSIDTNGTSVFIHWIGDDWKLHHLILRDVEHSDFQAREVGLSRMDISIHERRDTSPVIYGFDNPANGQRENFVSNSDYQRVDAERDRLLKMYNNKKNHIKTITKRYKQFELERDHLLNEATLHEPQDCQICDRILTSTKCPECGCNCQNLIEDSLCVCSDADRCMGCESTCSRA